MKIDTKIVLCQECIHQKKTFHKDRRYKKGGYWIYSCELNEDPFTSHAVNGIDYEFCSTGERRKDGSTQTQPDGNRC